MINKDLERLTCLNAVMQGILTLITSTALRIPQPFTIRYVRKLVKGPVEFCYELLVNRVLQDEIAAQVKQEVVEFARNARLRYPWFGGGRNADSRAMGSHLKLPLFEVKRHAAC
jgi:hypothetical protein